MKLPVPHPQVVRRAGGRDHRVHEALGPDGVSTAPSPGLQPGCVPRSGHSWVWPRAERPDRSVQLADDVVPARVMLQVKEELGPHGGAGGRRRREAGGCRARAGKVCLMVGGSVDAWGGLHANRESPGVRPGGALRSFGSGGFAGPGNPRATCAGRLQLVRVAGPRRLRVGCALGSACSRGGLAWGPV